MFQLVVKIACSCEVCVAEQGICRLPLPFCYTTSTVRVIIRVHDAVDFRTPSYLLLYCSKSKFYYVLLTFKFSTLLPPDF